MKGKIFGRWLGLSLIILVVLVIGWRLWLVHPPDDSRESLSVRIERAIPRAVRSMERQQLPSGAFPGVLCETPEMTNCFENITPFYGTFVLHALSFLPEEPSPRMKEAAVAYLLATQDRPGIWRHYQRGTSRYAWATPDSDDTACMRAALVTVGQPPTEGVQELLNLLTEEGSFWLWLGMPPEANETDCAATANVVFDLALEGRHVPQAVDYLNRVIVQRTFEYCSRYYPAPEALFYFLSRAYHDAGVNGLEPAVRLVSEELRGRQRPDGSFGNVVTTAFALLTWLNAGQWNADAERGVTYLLDHQRRDGGWNAAVTYSRVVIGGGFTHSFFGSEAMTTALVLEALVKASDQRIR